MKVNVQTQTTAGLNYLSRDQVEDLHSATLEVLEKVGIEVLEQEALELLRKGGARISGSRAHIGEWMVKRALSTAPSRITLSDRLGNTALVLEKNRIHYGTGSDTPYHLDLDGQRRPTVLEDVSNAAKLSDALPNIDFVMSLGIPVDVPKKDCDVYQFEAMVLNTTKPILYTAQSVESLYKIIEMAQIVAGGATELKASPFLCLYNEPSSPLRHSREALLKLLYCAEMGLPINHTPAVMMGGTGPVTMAGALVVANCELLSGLVIHQLKNEGAPIIYGGGVPPMDLRTTVSSYGAPEVQMGDAALVALGKYYGLPVFTASGCSDAHLFDQQAGMEAGYSILMAGLAGGNLIHDNGYLGAGMMSSLEMLILCDETIGLVKHILQGISVDKETLAVDVIAKVGPGGNYLAEEHTFKHFRQSLHIPALLNRKNHDNWENGGSTTYGQRANDKARSMLENHETPHLYKNIVDEIKKVVQRS